MAKRKKSKSPVRTARRGGGKPPRRPSKTAAKKKPAKKAAAGPIPVSSGRGADPARIGAEVVRMLHANTGDKAIWDAWWSPQCESIEGSETRLAWRGRKQIQAKSDWWNSENEVVDGNVEGPYVGATAFSIRFRVQVRTKATGATQWMDEVGVYTVQNGKVVREEFMGLAPASKAAGAPSIALENAMA
ncbi:MAG: nuclear transport factor 2 family protein [Phycisphaerales bacterium]